MLLAMSALAGLIMPDRYYSEREKRTLAQKPQFTIADFISGKFDDEPEKYLTDQVPLPTVPAEEITAWYKLPNRHASYNGGQYETDSIYERKYLDSSNQYAVFLNSNQAQTVIEGSGKSGRLLLIKDSYGNTFSQFPVEDYAEVHVIDPRFFKGDVVEYAKENGITDTLMLYGVKNVTDENLCRRYAAERVS